MAERELHRFEARPIDGTRGYVEVRVVEQTEDLDAELPEHVGPRGNIRAEALVYDGSPLIYTKDPESSDWFDTVSAAEHWATEYAHDYLTT
jgi:hypothetical protein